MTTLADIAATLERMDRAQQVRDDGLKTAFGILTGAISRSNSVLDLIHREATEARQAAEHVQEMLVALPDQIREALEGVFSDDD